jgi:type II secretory pathway component PulK
VRQADVSPDAFCFGVRQRGMAVIVALLVVALVAVIATALLTRQSAQLRALRGDQLRAQVRMAVDATLERAAQQLREDVKEQLTTVRSGRWARPLELQAPLPVQLQLVDAQSMFNLRNLLAHGRPDPRRGARSSRCVPGRGWARAPAHPPRTTSRRACAMATCRRRRRCRVNH